MNRRLGWAFGAAVAAAPMAVWANGAAEGYHRHGHAWGGGWGHMMVGPLMMILAIAVVAAVVVLIVRWLGGPAAGGGTPGHAPHGPAARTPLDILKERYARGELDTAEFEERRKALGE